MKAETRADLVSRTTAGGNRGPAKTNCIKTTQLPCCKYTGKTWQTGISLKHILCILKISADFCLSKAIKISLYRSFFVVVVFTFLVYFLQHDEATKSMSFMVAIWSVTTCWSCSWARSFRGQTVEPQNPTGLGYRHYTHINHHISWQCNQVSKTSSLSHGFFLLAWQVQLGKTDTPQCLCSTSKPQMCVCVCPLNHAWVCARQVFTYALRYWWSFPEKVANVI